MPDQVSFLATLELADGADKRLLTRVGLDMPSQIDLLLGIEITERAGKRLLVGVHTEVGKKIRLFRCGVPAGLARVQYHDGAGARLA